MKQLSDLFPGNTFQINGEGPVLRYIGYDPENREYIAVPAEVSTYHLSGGTDVTEVD